MKGSLRVCLGCSETFVQEWVKQPRCKPCKRIYDRAYHKSRPIDKKDEKLRRIAERAVESKLYVWNYLLQHPCVICGEDDPVVLEFDHLDQETKLGNISELHKWSLLKVQEEIKKCRVLCANCHRRHTAVQMGWYEYIQDKALR